MSEPASALALVEFALERLAYCKMPGWVILADSLPVACTQKIRKRDIFGAVEDPRSRVDCHDFRVLKRPDVAGGARPAGKE